MARKKGTSPRGGKTAKGKELFTLEVRLIDGPVTEEFVQKNPEVTRTIEIRGDQTLAQLHETLFDAFDRFDEHMYEFQFGKEPAYGGNKRYVLPFAEDPNAEGTIKAKLGTLGLKEGSSFFYWFDFGDDWWHEIKVVSIRNEAPKGKYPRVSARVGESPPQYEEEEDWEEDYEEDPGMEDFGGEASADAACLVAEMHLKEHRYTEAVLAFSRAIQLNPTVDAYQGRAKACRLLAEQDEQAIEEMSQTK